MVQFITGTQHFLITHPTLIFKETLLIGRVLVDENKLHITILYILKLLN